MEIWNPNTEAIILKLVSLEEVWLILTWADLSVQIRMQLALLWLTRLNITSVPSQGQ